MHDVVTGLIMLLAACAGGGAGWVLGRWDQRGDYEDPGGLLDDAYEEGRADERGEAYELESAAGYLRSPEWGRGPAADAEAGSALHTQGTAEQSQQGWGVDRCESRQEPANDFLHPDWEQLAPDRIDLPGPADGRAVRAGEFQQLPALLALGQIGDGSERTFQRAALMTWDMTARFERDRVVWRRECGLEAA